MNISSDSVCPKCGWLPYSTNKATIKQTSRTISWKLKSILPLRAHVVINNVIVGGYLISRVNINSAAVEPVSQPDQVASTGSRVELNVS